MKSPISVFGHGNLPPYARPGVNPTVLACRSSLVSRVASACATARPNAVIL